MLIYEGMSIDQIYEKQKKLNEEKKESQESSLERNHLFMSELVYEKLLEQKCGIWPMPVLICNERNQYGSPKGEAFTLENINRPSQLSFVEMLTEGL